ncbi:hypothetical protein [Nocardia sp. XZ_19_231]|uniref:hypothetical protein n=1 Tax=Nocardia sp. XZ_19_231 TaxID=2769252 RepID=UPI00188EE2E4|nr:hypothetical protein [Nocardia sp. XZ_19_231]
MAMPDRAQPDERDRQGKALELRLMGMTYAKIAEHLGYADESGAYRAVEAVLKRVESQLAEELRKMEDMRLDALLRRQLPAALRGDQKATELVLKIHDRRVKLHGLAMPEKFIIQQVDKDAAALDIQASLDALGYVPPVTPLEPDDPDNAWSNIE